MNRLRRLLVTALLLAPAASALAEELPLMKIYKTPTCGCCGVWVDHVKAAGFPVDVTDMRDVTPVKLQYGITPRLSSCHTAIVDGLVFEGHIPAGDIIRLLKERPAGVKGLAVPGMPIGSPGMEGPRPERYDVLAIAEDGRTSVYATHGP